jgi:transmembrane sensor
MDRQVRSKMNTQIYEEACAWFVECRAGDLDDSGRREFDRWLRKSPEHLSSYIEIAAIWNEGPLLDPDSKWTADTLIQHALSAGDDNVVSLSGAAVEAIETGAATASTLSAEKTSRTASGHGTITTRTQPAAPRKAWFTGWRRLAIAASIAGLTILAGALGLMEFSSPIYATALGEQRSIQFEDGSTVELNSRSRIRVKYSKQERDVELIEGQALFHVAHDVGRPFIVAVGATRVRAVGTQFDVYKKSNGTVVTVVEGRVAVYSAPQSVLSDDPPRLPPIEALPPTRPGAVARPARQSSGTKISSESLASGSALPPAGGTAQQDLSINSSSLLLGAGEQVTVTAVAAQKTANPNIAGATAWREREIVFESATLSDVAEEFNRYNQRQLVIRDPALYGFHISGVFSSTDPNSLIKFLQQRPGVKVTEAGSEILVERATP